MSILDNAKDIANAVHEIQNIELYQRVVSLHGDIVGLVEENIRLREENKELSNKLRLKDSMQFRAPFYFQEGDATPYCPACWESKSSAVHVIRGTDDDQGSTHWACPVCKHSCWARAAGYRQRNPAGNVGGFDGDGGWMR